MKKLLAAAVVTALLVLPLGNIAIAEDVETSAPQVEAYLPGDAPAEVSVADAMSPALHALVLSMLNHDQVTFDPADPALAWESVYNMLSMYGQLDERSEYQGEDLLVPSEEVFDYASSILPDLSVLGELPQSMSDRMTYDAGSDSYLVACGTDDLSEVRLTVSPLSDGSYLLSGSLVYLAEDLDLAQFQAVLQPASNMFGCTISGMEIL